MIEGHLHLVKLGAAFGGYPLTMKERKRKVLGATTPVWRCGALGHVSNMPQIQPALRRLDTNSCYVRTRRHFSVPLVHWAVEVGDEEGTHGAVAVAGSSLALPIGVGWGCGSNLNPFPSTRGPSA